MVPPYYAICSKEIKSFLFFGGATAVEVPNDWQFGSIVGANSERHLSACARNYHEDKDPDKAVWGANYLSVPNPIFYYRICIAPPLLEVCPPNSMGTYIFMVWRAGPQCDCLHVRFTIKRHSNDHMLTPPPMLRRMLCSSLALLSPRFLHQGW